MRYYLVLSTYIGVSFDASHYYARIRSDEIGFDAVDMAMPKKQGRVTISTIRLPNREKAIELGQEWFRKNAGPNDTLILGQHYNSGPQEILLGPAKTVEAGNEIYRQYTVLYDSGKEDAPEEKRLYTAWDALFPQPAPKAKPARRRPPPPDGD